MDQFKEIGGAFPDTDGAEDHQEEFTEESLVFTPKGGDLFGKPTISPSFYLCSTHGKILSQDVSWDANDVPHCPKAGCGAVLTR